MIIPDIKVNRGSVMLTVIIINPNATWFFTFRLSLSSNP